MSTSFDQWMALQDEWSRRLDDNAKKIMYRYLAVIPVFCVAAVLLMGRAAHPEALPALDSLKKGAVLSAALDLACLLILVPALPGRRCRRQLRKMVNRFLFTAADREAFAGQMLGRGGSTACCVSWMDKSTDENRVWVTRDYVLKISGTGRVQLICLKEAEQMEPDSRLHTWILGRRDLRLLCRRRMYRIRFYYSPAYRQMARWHERLRGGPRITFRSRQLRDQVVEAVRSLTGRF